MRIRTNLTSIAMASLAALSAGAQRRLPPDSVVLKMIRERVEAGRASGIAVGMIEAGGRRTVAYGPGARGAPIDEHSVFEIGSITKTFTATILADAVARHEVRLDQPVVELLPKGTKIPARNGRQITLLDLATQSSGLPRMPDNFAPKDSTNPYPDYDGARMLAFLAKYELPRDVGAKYEYSNLGVGLLGYALAQHAGVSYERLLTDRVLHPLEMRESAITLSPALRGRLAPGHDEAGTPVNNWDFDAMAGAGALRSTTSDMLRYLAANMDSTSKPLGPTLALAHVKRFQSDQPNLSLGLAWHRLASPTGDTIVWHNGGTGGYHSFIGWDPARRIGVVVLSNSAGSIDDIALHILDERIPLASPPVKRAEVAVAPEKLNRYVGEYQLAPTFSIVITRDGSKLFAQATAQPQFQLFAESETKFFLKVVDAQVEFALDGTGKATGLVLIQNGARQQAKKIK